MPSWGEWMAYQTRQQIQTIEYKGISAPLVHNVATACPVSQKICSKIQINFSFCWTHDFCGCRKTHKLFLYIVYMNFKHVYVSQQCLSAVTVWYLALRADITELTPVWTLLNLIMFTIYCKIWTGLLPPCMHWSWHSDVHVYTFILYEWFTVP